MTRWSARIFGRRSGRQMPSKIEHRHDPAAGEDGLHVMLDDDRRDPALADQVADMLEQAKRFLGRKARAGFVHEQKLRPADQRQRHVDPALHAVGDASGFLFEIVAEIHDLDHIRDPIVAEAPCDERELLADGKILEYVRALK